MVAYGATKIIRLRKVERISVFKNGKRLWVIQRNEKRSKQSGKAAKHKSERKYGQVWRTISRITKKLFYWSLRQ